MVTFKRNWFGPHKMVYTQDCNPWLLSSVWLQASRARQTSKHETEDQCHWLHWCIQTLLCKNTIYHWWRNAGQVYEGLEPRCAKGTPQAGSPNICSCLPDGRASSLPGSCDRSTSSNHKPKPKQKQTTLHKQPISLRWISANRRSNVTAWLPTSKRKPWPTSAELVWPEWVIPPTSIWQTLQHQLSKSKQQCNCVPLLW